MRYPRILALLVFGSVTALHGQSLDIGGIEIRMGQQTTEVVSQLRAAYAVIFDEGTKSWFVTKIRDGTGPFVWVGHFAATNGTVSFISKGYVLSGVDDLATVYTQAINELHKRGGKNCVTLPVAFADGVVGLVKTTCGQYALNLMLPWKHENGDVVGAGVSINVKSNP